MKPSLFSLFQRSKYHGASPTIIANEEDSDAMEAKWSQRERFAVVSIAYCLQNNTDFRKHFLTSVCDAPPEELPSSFDILIEDELWGDLVLIEQNERKVYVVECKVDASLEDRQNPATDVFWQAPEGYGKQMVRRFPDGSTELRYIVFGYKEKLKLRTGRPDTMLPTGVGKARWLQWITDDF